MIYHNWTAEDYKELGPHTCGYNGLNKSKTKPSSECKRCLRNREREQHQLEVGSERIVVGQGGKKPSLKEYDGEID